ncbi:MAG: phasin family protein [Hyphomicrobiaceae bacterium]
MSDAPQFEIPPAIRELAERNVEQARSAYSQFIDAATKAQDVVSRSSDAMTTGVRELQDKAMQYTASNMEASFSFARDLARARDLKEALDLQQAYARRQMEIFAEQAQELTRLMTSTAERARPKG